MTRVTKEERQKDQQILGAIIAAGESSGRQVAREHFSFGVRNHEQQRPCCAVGLGVIFHGITLTSDPLRDFAYKYDVTYEYARGVSAGFEGHSRWRDQELDWNRGYDVGLAAYRALVDANTPEP